MSPFESRHINRQRLAASSITRITLQPLDKTRTQVPQGKGTRRALGKVSAREVVKGAFPDYSSKAWEVRMEGIQNAEPVTTAVNFEALRRGHSPVGFDIRRVSGVIYPVGAGERRENGPRHTCLHFEQSHNVIRARLLRYFSALRASACTSSKDGIRSSHSSRVAVGPMRRMACSYIFQTGR